MHEGKHGILDDLDDMDKLFGTDEDDVHEHEHDHEHDHEHNHHHDHHDHEHDHKHEK